MENRQRVQAIIIQNKKVLFGAGMLKVMGEKLYDCTSICYKE